MKIRAIIVLATLVTILTGCNTTAPQNSLSFRDICKEQGLCGGGGGH